MLGDWISQDPKTASLYSLIRNQIMVMYTAYTYLHGMIPEWCIKNKATLLRSRICLRVEFHVVTTMPERLQRGHPLCVVPSPGKWIPGDGPCSSSQAGKKRFRPTFSDSREVHSLVTAQVPIACHRIVGLSLGMKTDIIVLE